MAATKPEIIHKQILVYPNLKYIQRCSHRPEMQYVQILVNLFLKCIQRCAHNNGSPSDLYMKKMHKQHKYREVFKVLILF